MNRTQWIDNAKGVAIVLVVLAHVWRGLRDAHLLAWTQTFQYLDFTVYSFHMPAFFILAGLTAHLSDTRKRSWVVPILQLYGVYLFWSLIQTSLMFALSRYTSGSTNFSDILLIPIKPNAQFWFILVLIVYRIIARLLPENLLVGSAVGAFVLATSFSRSESAPFQISHFLLFFVVGYVGPRWITKRIPDAGLVGTAALAVGTTFIMPFALMQIGLRQYDSIFALPLAAMGALAIYCCASSMEQSQVGRLFNVLGRYSLAIYILHIIVASGFRVVLTRLGVHNGYVLLAVCTLAGIGLPIAAYLTAKRIGLEPLFTMKWDSLFKSTSAGKEA